MGKAGINFQHDGDVMRQWLRDKMLWALHEKKMLQTFLRAGTRCYTTSCNFLMQWFEYCLNDGAHTISPKELWWKEHLEKDDKTKLKF